MSKKPVFTIQTRTNEPVTVGDTTVVTESQAVTIPWPGGGWVWNRPTAVYVYHQGIPERIPIIDTTRQAVLALMGFTAVITFLITLAGRRRRPQK